MDWLTIFAAVAAICSLALLFIQIANWLTGGNLGKAGLSKDLERKLDRVGDIAERTESALRDEHQRMRKEADDNARDTRKELGDNILKLGNSLQNTLSESLSAIDRRKKSTTSVSVGGARRGFIATFWSFTWVSAPA